MALAWPLRRTEPLTSSRRGVAATSAPVAAAGIPADGDKHAAAKPIVAFEVTGPRNPSARPDDDPFAGAAQQARDATSTPPTLFNTVSNVPEDAQPPVTPPPPAQRIHVVHQGDSLDRLAKRYLGDEARALEIFDLNREVLDNPHVLRLGTELKIPPSAE